jgi:hypothetical protein
VRHRIVIETKNPVLLCFFNINGVKRLVGGEGLEPPTFWVLNETLAPTFIKNARNALSPEDVALVTFHLKRYVISRDK